MSNTRPKTGKRKPAPKEARLRHRRTTRKIRVAEKTAELTPTAPAPIVLTEEEVLWLRRAAGRPNARPQRQGIDAWMAMAKALEARGLVSIGEDADKFTLAFCTGAGIDAIRAAKRGMRAA